MKKRIYIRPLMKMHKMDTNEPILASSNPQISVKEEEVSDEVEQYSKKYGSFGENAHPSVWDD